VGDYRIVYTIADDVLLIVVVVLDIVARYMTGRGRPAT
jgi:mRNA-degrading endonuclease RelE of RelBE toxin-antitoxin system